MTVTVTWTSSDLAVATVANWVVTAVGNGTATIEGTVDVDGTTLTGSVTVNVSQIPTQLAFRTQPVGGDERAPLPVQPVIETQDANGNVATNDNATSVTAALASGPTGALLTGTTSAVASEGVATFTDLIIDSPGTGFTIEFTAPGLTAATSEAITIDLVISSVTVDPDVVTLESFGETATLVATALDLDQQPVTGITFDWQCSPTGIVDISTDGEITAVANGATQCTATAGGQSGTADVTVQQVAETVVVTPELSVLDAGTGTGDVDVVVQDALGQAIASPSFSCETDDAGVAAVTGTTISAAGAGVTRVICTSDLVPDTAWVASVATEGFAVLLSTASDVVTIEGTSGANITLDLLILNPPAGTGDLGSIQGSLTWDPADLTYQSSQVSEIGFTWIPNETQVGTGSLPFAAFSAVGSSGTFTLAQVTFTVAGAPGGGNSALTLALTAAGNSIGTNIVGLLQVVNSEVEIK